MEGHGKRIVSGMCLRRWGKSSCGPTGRRKANLTRGNAHQPALLHVAQQFRRAVGTQMQDAGHARERSAATASLSGAQVLERFFPLHPCDRLTLDFPADAPPPPGPNQQADEADNDCPEKQRRV